MDAEEREIPLGGDPESREPHKRGFLAYVWEVVGRAALEQVLGAAESKARNGAAGALEEDARLTALFLWTLQATTQDAEPVSTTDDEDVDAEPDDDDEDEAPSSKKKKKGLSLPFDVARRFAQPLGIHLDAWEGRCIETEKGIVRLVPVLDRAEQLFRRGRAPRSSRIAWRSTAQALSRRPFSPSMTIRRPHRSRADGEKGLSMSPTNRCTSIAARQRSTTSTRRCCNCPAGPMLCGPC